jgi:hypothetical protein
MKISFPFETMEVDVSRRTSFESDWINSFLNWFFPCRWSVYWSNIPFWFVLNTVRCLHCCFLWVIFDWSAFFKSFYFYSGVLVDELINTQIASTHLYVDFVLVKSNGYFFSSELINSFRLSHKHDFQFVFFWEVIYVLC